jgi:hypothetical protein
MGFVAGAVFWHFVGFWGFVSQVVLKGPVGPHGLETGSISRPDAPARAAQASPNTPWLTQRGGPDIRCTQLVLDRRRGETRLATCPQRAERLPLVDSGGRGDALPVAAAASAQAAQTSRALAATAGLDLDAARFDWAGAGRR